MENEIPLKDKQTNALASVTIPAVSGRSAVIDWILAGYDDRTLSFLLSIESPSGTVRLEYPVHGSDGFSVSKMSFLPNTAVVVKLPAGGVGKVGTLNVGYHYNPQ